MYAALGGPTAETTLLQIAEITGAKYFRATNEKKLAGIYHEIDQFEKTNSGRGFLYALRRPIFPAGIVCGDHCPFRNDITLYHFQNRTLMRIENPYYLFGLLAIPAVIVIFYCVPSLAKKDAAIFRGMGNGEPADRRTNHFSPITETKHPPRFPVAADLLPCQCANGKC
jgi:hypothetical protein